MVNTNTVSIRYLKTIGIVNNGFNGRGFANPYDVAFGEDEEIFVLNRCDPARRSAIRVGCAILMKNIFMNLVMDLGMGMGK